MTEKEKKEGIFKKAVDAFSTRDEKETIAELEAELEQAKKEAEEAKQAVKSMAKQNLDARKDSSKTDAELETAEKKIAQLEERIKGMTVKKGKRFDEIREKLDKPKIITVHTVESNNQTLSHVALKYYKHATPPYWKYLLEHNKEVLNGSEKNIRMGMELEIPELPDDLKD